MGIGIVLITFYCIYSIIRLKREDIEEYVRFCLNPPKAWIGTKNVPRFLTSNGSRNPNEEWRPFVVTVTKEQHRKGKLADKKDYVMSQPGVKALFTAISSFYDYLICSDRCSWKRD